MIMLSVISSSSPPAAWASTPICLLDLGDEAAMR
jgi:hypothetical protein